MIFDITENERRLGMIICVILKLYQNDQRRILVLGKTIKFLERIKKLLEIYDIDSMCYVSKTKTKDRKKILKSSRIILGTFQMFSNSLNIEKDKDIMELNTLIFAMPCKNDVFQASARIIRGQLVKSGSPPCIIDIQDQFSCFIGQGRFRHEFYKGKEYLIKEMHIWSKLNPDEMYSKINEKLYDSFIDPTIFEDDSKEIEKEKKKHLKDVESELNPLGSIIYGPCRPTGPINIYNLGLAVRK